MTLSPLTRRLLAVITMNKLITTRRAFLASAGASAGLFLFARETGAAPGRFPVHLSDYNLFVFEDYSGGHDVAGRVAAG